MELPDPGGHHKGLGISDPYTYDSVDERDFYSTDSSSFSEDTGGKSSGTESHFSDAGSHYRGGSTAEDKIWKRHNSKRTARPNFHTHTSQRHSEPAHLLVPRISHSQNTSNTPQASYGLASHLYRATSSPMVVQQQYASHPLQNVAPTAHQAAIPYGYQVQTTSHPGPVSYLTQPNTMIPTSYVRSPYHEIYQQHSPYHLQNGHTMAHQFHEFESRSQSSRSSAPRKEDESRIARLEKLIRQQADAQKAKEQATENALVEKAKLKEAAAQRADEIALASETAARLAREAAEEGHKVAEEKKREAAALAIRNGKPIKFHDAIGRKFRFPFQMCSTWAGMEFLIKEAFVGVDEWAPQVTQGRYSLIGPDDAILLPLAWETSIEPDWTITMHMWPPEELPKKSESEIQEPKIIEIVESKKASKSSKTSREVKNEKKSATSSNLLLWASGKKVENKKKPRSIAVNGKSTKAASKPVSQAKTKKPT